DLWSAAVMKRPGQWVNADRYVPEKIFANSRMYNELIRPLGDDTFHGLGLFVPAPWGFCNAAVHRGEVQQPFGAEDEEVLRPIVNHLSQVLRIRGDLAAARREARLAKGALDNLALALITVGRGGCVFAQNVAAEILFQRADGLVIRRGALTGATAASAGRLRDAVARATAAEPVGSWIRMDRRPEEHPYLIAVLPQPGGASTALVVLRDPDLASEGSVKSLRALYGLTAAEAAIASELTGGRSPDEVAEARGVSIETVRSQLKALAAKMGVSRQSEIVATIAAMPPVRG
ncbi:MAG: helix-turn-helix transcriptional regulator, partial [Caulobacteraceae bacterium]